MDGQTPRPGTRADKSWATAWQTERRVPGGFQGGGRWTRGGAFVPAQQQAAGQGEHEGAGRESTEQAERQQFRRDLAEAKQIEEQVRDLRAELRQMQNPSASASTAGATTGSGNVSGQLASQQASTAAGQQASQQSFNQWLRQQQAQQNAIEQQIRQLEERARDLRAQAAALFRESKTAEGEVAKARRKRSKPARPGVRQVALSGEPVWEAEPRHTDGRVSKENTMNAAKRPRKKPKAEKAETTWAEVYQPRPVGAGHAADSPGSDPAARVRRQLAEGRYAGPDGPWGLRMNFQPRAPEPGMTLATVSGAGPLASSIHQHQGQARLAHYPAAAHASPDLHGQLGMRAPSGVPVQAGFHTAPTGHGMVAGHTPARDGTGQAVDWTGHPGGNRTMPAGQGRVPSYRPPGCEFSMRSPSDG